MYSSSLLSAPLAMVHVSAFVFESVEQTMCHRVWEVGDVPIVLCNPYTLFMTLSAHCGKCDVRVSLLTGRNRYTLPSLPHCASNTVCSCPRLLGTDQSTRYTPYCNHCISRECSLRTGRPHRGVLVEFGCSGARPLFGFVLALRGRIVAAHCERTRAVVTRRLHGCD
jgi:hypothetical protein